MTPGAPCWFELATSDRDAAKRFYATLFGWSAVETQPDYTVFQLDGKSVAAAYPAAPAERVRWNIYFAVEDIDAAAAAVDGLGGKVTKAPFAVGEYGRMAIVTDPQGAEFVLWQAGSLAGVERMQTPNAVLWVELATRGIAQTADFYSALLGWTTKPHAGAPDAYRIFSAGGQDWGGLLEMDADWGDKPSFWSFYVWSTDVDANIEQARALEGRVFAPPFDAPGVGRLAMLSDPTGARFALLTPSPAA
jgi:predicted enzyme related to lactoylglutathione lyase